MGDASAFERFTKSILAELKDLEPGGHASRGHGRANYLSTGEPNPMQEDLDTLYQNQEIIMNGYISWVSSQNNSSEILNEKRTKELAKEAFSECQADFMFKHAPASASRKPGLGATVSCAEQGSALCSNNLTAKLPKW